MARAPSSSRRVLDVDNSKASGKTGSNINPVLFTLLDPSVLDCEICFEPFTAPIYQCKNGHISCGGCKTAMKGKCGSCFCSNSLRCRAVEKILESIEVLCQNSEYGCKETFRYDKMSDHEKKCLFVPCSCPLHNCGHKGPYTDLYKHLKVDHKTTSIPFDLDTLLRVTLERVEKLFVFEETKHSCFFMVENKVGSEGNFVTLCYIAPPEAADGHFRHSLCVETPERSLTLRSNTESYQTSADAMHAKNFLMIPTDYFSGSLDGKLKLEIFIMSM